MAREVSELSDDEVEAVFKAATLADVRANPVVLPDDLSSLSLDQLIELRDRLSCAWMVDKDNRPRYELQLEELRRVWPVLTDTRCASHTCVRSTSCVTL